MGGREPSIQRHTNIMVKYKTILSVIEQNINTPTITKHSNFQYNIEGLLRQITDNKEEYKTLKEDIWRFYKETKKSDHEEIILKGIDGSFFENRKGEHRSVEIPSEVEDYVDKGGKLLYSIHNHPYVEEISSCLQSLSDFRVMSYNGVKYSISIGKDGIMITKNPNHRKDNEYRLHISNDYELFNKGIVGKFNDEYAIEIENLKIEYDVDNKDYSELDEYREKHKELFQDYCSNNISEFVNRLDSQFNTVKQDPLYDDVIFDISEDIDIFYVPKNPRIY